VLALPAGFDAPRLLRYDDVTAHAITRDDLGADVRGINASLDPSRKNRRPPKRKTDVYRPSLDELRRIRMAAAAHERPPILLMEGVGLRRSEVLACRWKDVDLMPRAGACPSQGAPLALAANRPRRLG
jgi:integrase